MSKNITSQVLRLVLKNYGQPYLHNVSFQKMKYGGQRTYVDFGNLFDKLKKNLSDIIEKKADGQDKQNQTIFKEKHESSNDKFDPQNKQTSDMNLLRTGNVGTKLRDQQKVNIQNERLTGEFEMDKKIQLPRDISDLLESHPKLKRNPHDVIKNYNLMLQSGLDELMIRENVQLLEDDPEELKEKLELILQFGSDLKDTILFGQLNLLELKAFLKACDDENIKPVDKIKFFCELFQEETYNVIIYLHKCKQLRTGSLKNLSEKIQVLLDEGFTISDIINNGPVLNYRLETIKSKIAKLRDIDSNEKNLSLMKKSSNELESIQSNKRKQESLNEKESQAIDCLVEKMKCDKIIASRLVAKLRKVDVEKMQQVFKILEESNIDLSQLLIRPQVFNRKADLLRQRLNQMKDMNFDDYNKLTHLMKTNKEFEEFLKKNSCAR